MKGLRVEDRTEYPGRFAKLFGSVLDAFVRHYWYIDGYGPFSITDKSNFRELDTELDRYSAYVQGLEDGPPGLWRPGIFPWAADLLAVDEGTTLVGIIGDENHAVEIATTLSNSHQTTARILELITENKIDLALIYVDGWWEVYSGDQALLRRIAEIEGARETDSQDLLGLL